MANLFTSCVKCSQCFSTSAHHDNPHTLKQINYVTLGSRFSQDRLSKPSAVIICPHFAACQQLCCAGSKSRISRAPLSKATQ